MIGQVLGPLPLRWEIQMEFLAAGFGPARPGPDCFGLLEQARTLSLSNEKVEKYVYDELSAKPRTSF